MGNIHKGKKGGISTRY